MKHLIHIIKSYTDLKKERLEILDNIHKSYGKYNWADENDVYEIEFPVDEVYGDYINRKCLGIKIQDNKIKILIWENGWESDE